MSKSKPPRNGKHHLYDCIIIGASPAGMTAAVYGARREMKTLIICGEVGGKMKWYSSIDFCNGVTHAILPKVSEMFEHHISSSEFPIELHSNDMAVLVQKNEDGFMVNTESDLQFHSKTLIICVGKIPKTLDIPGDELCLHGRYVSICDSSDAPLYKGKKIVIIGGGDSAMDTSLQLSKITDSVTIMTDIPCLKGNPKRIQKVIRDPHIVIKTNVKILEILVSEKKVKGVRYSENKGAPQVLECEGIFEEIGYTPDTHFLKDFLYLNEKGEIPVDKLCTTQYPGLFAAGNCTDQPHKQAIIAIGDGATAALEAEKFNNIFAKSKING